jgi:hypothetical protein
MPVDKQPILDISEDGLNRSGLKKDKSGNVKSKNGIIHCDAPPKYIDDVEGMLEELPRNKQNAGRNTPPIIKMPIGDDTFTKKTGSQRPNRVGRTYRNQRRFADMPSNAEDNYERKQLKNRQPEDLVKRITQFAKAAKKDREVCIEIALEEFLEKYTLD